MLKPIGVMFTHGVISKYNRRIRPILKLKNNTIEANTEDGYLVFWDIGDINKTLKVRNE